MRLVLLGPCVFSIDQKMWGIEGVSVLLTAEMAVKPVDF